MSKEKATPPANPGRNTKTLSEQSLTILIKEYDSLRELYTHAESSAQNLFNFYLTLVTTVIGGVIVVSQLSATNALEIIQSQLLVIGIISFAALVGSIYSSALSVRYANMARYAHCMNEIRKNLLNTVDVSLPDFYESLLKPRASKRSKRNAFDVLNIWLAPTGTYHFFISVINSACLAIVFWLILNIAGYAQANLNKSVGISFAIFTILYFTYNFFSRFMVLRVVSRMKARLGTGRDIESVFQDS